MQFRQRISPVRHEFVDIGKRDSGQTLVEFALVLPLLVIVLFGMVEFSLVMYNQAMITNAAREGARFAGLFRSNGTSGDFEPYTSAEIQSVVAGYLNNHLVTFSGPPNPPPAVVVPAIISDTDRGAVRTVTVTYPYSFLVLPNFVALGPKINLTAVSQMRIE
jgi:Flp pilus assembly protein TadG